VAAVQPSGDAWLDHVRRDLLPWWLHPDAQGRPVGRFPTFRCHDGRAYVAADPCPELATAPEGVRGELGRDYVRMQSRQVFAYAMGFHLTGNVGLLELARAGVADLRARTLDPATGSAVTWHAAGGSGPGPGLRNAQDLSYAGLGLAAWYYVTRDETVLADLVRLKDHVFAVYRDPETGLIRWVARDDGSGEYGREELVATLDQLNAYLILVTPVLPEGALERRWRRDIADLSAALVGHFHDDVHGRFRGTRGRADSDAAGARHNDFGHTVKAYWMLYLGARLNGDAALAGFARDGMRRTLDRAWLADGGSWGERWEADGRVRPTRSWWIHAELDQAAATLAVAEGDDPSRFLQAARWWLAHFVDRDRGEVWGSLGPEGTPPPGGLKQHQWKNGFHSFEHAVVGYLASQALAGEPATLHFAVPRGGIGVRLRPYTFDGRVVASETRRVDGVDVQRVRFALTRR
jgi:mannose/cellobiose epimerase-like protein (N-acyl-D-glucosamine 2-epimerase family)